MTGIVLFAFSMKTTLAHVGDGLSMTRTLGRGRLVAALVRALRAPLSAS